jgi:hypothetical protein
MKIHLIPRLYSHPAVARLLHRRLETKVILSESGIFVFVYLVTS